MDFWGTFGSGFLLLLVGAAAFAAWHDPKVYLRLFWLPAIALLVGAGLLGAMSTVYGWGWNDAVEDAAKVSPQIATQVPLRTGDRQAIVVWGLVLGCLYIVFMAFVARMRRESVEARPQRDEHNKPKP